MSFIAVFAVMTAALIGASRLTGDTARAEQTLTLNQSNVVHPGAAATGTCPTPPAGQESWYGWHFVAPSNENFTSLTVNFASAGTISANPFPGTTFISHPDLSHAYVWTPTADTLLSGTATIAGTFEQGFFNLSHTCAPSEPPEDETGSITIVKQGLGEGATASFSQDIDASGSFNLTAGANTKLFSDVAVGTYTVTEADLAGYTLSGASCTGGGGGDGSLSGRTLTIDLDADENLTCTFVNAVAQSSEQHTVTVTKYIDGALATTGDFSLTATWTAANLNGGAQASGNFNLNSGNGWQAMTALMDAGADYSVVENGIDGTCDQGDSYRLAGYGIGVDIPTAIAAPLAGTASIDDLQADMHIVVFNVSCGAVGAQHQVIVTKYIDGALATTGDFSLTATWTAANLNGGAETSGDFSLNAGNGFQAMTALMDAGAEYSVVENGIDGACEGDDEYRLEGYGIGATLELAAAATPAATASIDNLQANMHIVVFNESCTQDSGSTVTIEKQGLLGDDVAEFTHDFETDGSFELSASENSITFENVAPGEYHVTELDLEGYTVAGAGCALAAGRSIASTEAIPNNTLIIVVGGQDLVCTFVNKSTVVAQYDVTVTKYIDGALATEGDFSLTSTWTAENLNEGETTSGDFSLNSGNSWAAVTSPMNAGSSYSVVENGIDGTCEEGDLYRLRGYGVGNSLEAAAEADPVAVAEITDLTEDMFIVVFNEECGTGSITIVKEWEDSEGTPIAGVDTSFTTSANLGLENNEFTLSEGSDSRVFTSLGTTTYTFTEAELEGWVLQSIFCDGDLIIRVDLAGRTLAVTLSEGETIVCTFTNRSGEAVEGTGSILIQKVWEDEAGAPVTPETTSFTTTGLEGATFDLSDTTEVELFDGLDDGDYVITETIPDGWTVSSIVCTGNTGSVWDTDFPTGVLSINLLNGEDLVCTFTNTVESGEEEGGSLTINKVWAGGDPVTANFTTTGLEGATFDLSDTTESEVFEDLADGNYVVTEAIPDGWTVTADCEGETASTFVLNAETGALSITLADDEDLVCTFTNTAEGEQEQVRVTTVKYLGNAIADEGSFNIRFTWTAANFNNGNPDTTDIALASGNNWQHASALMDSGADFSVQELDVDAQCDSGDAYRLLGYGVGATLDEADDGVDSTTIGELTNITSDMYIVVFNEACTTNGGTEGGSLSIFKVWTGGTAPAEGASFTTSDSLNDPDDAFTIVGGSPMLFSNLANGGVYTVTENPGTGFTLNNIDCGDPVSTIVLVGNSVTVTLANNENVVCTFTNDVQTNVSPSFPETPGETPTTPNMPNVPNPNVPGVPNTPNVPNMPNVPNQPGPVTNIPPTSQQPGVVSSESPSSNVGGFQQPLPPATGNSTSEGNANASLALAAGLAAILGVAAAATYGLRRR